MARRKLSAFANSVATIYPWQAVPLGLASQECFSYLRSLDFGGGSEKPSELAQ